MAFWFLVADRPGIGSHRSHSRLPKRKTTRNYRRRPQLFPKSARIELKIQLMGAQQCAGINPPTVRRTARMPAVVEGLTSAEAAT
jgi:hypothetical protein